jgi:hypothetical protein
MAFKDAGGWFEADRKGQPGNIEPGGVQAVNENQKPLLFCPFQEQVRLFGAHPLSIEGIIIHELVLTHPGLPGMPEWGSNS